MKHVLRTLFPILVGGAILAGCGHSVVPDHTADPAAAPAPVSSPPGGAWTVSPRTVPPPAQASAELRGSIAAAPVPDAAATAQFAPSTPEEWEAALAQFGGPQAEGVIDGLSAALSVTIEPGDIMGVKVYHVRPAEVSPDHAAHLFVHVHGGAYVFGGGEASASEAAVIAAAGGIPVVSIDYRMPPDHPFPAAVDDVVAVWEHLLTERPGSAIGLGGTSAGGGLALAATHRFMERGLDVPGAIYAGTPWSDLTKTGDSQFTNEGIDRVLVGYDGLLSASAHLYAGDHDLKDPLLSPIYGDFEGFPPTYLVTGTRDLFLSDVVRTHRKLREAGVVADLNVYEGMSHAGYLMVQDAPESQQVFAELGAFLRQHLQ